MPTSTKGRKTVIRLLAAIGMIVGLALTASPAHASGGGCSDKTDGGFAVGVCSSDDGINMYRDFYINSASWSGSCYSQGRIWRSDIGDATGWSSPAGCAVGRWVGSSYYIRGLASSITLHHEVRIRVNGITVFQHRSNKPTRCC